MLTEEQEKKIILEVSKINERNAQLYKDDIAWKDEVKNVKDTDTVEYSSYEKLKNEWSESVSEIKRVLNSEEIRKISENVANAVKSDEKNSDVKELDHALYIEGIIKVDEALSVLKFDKKAYEEGSLKNPFRLKANIRINAERGVLTLQNLLVNSVPLDKELIKKLDPRQAIDAFKGVYLDAFDKLEECHRMHPNIEAVKNMLRMRECALKFIAYPLEMSNVYCSALDASLPIDRGLVEWQDKQLTKIKENQNIIDGQSDKVALLNRQNATNEDLIKVQQQQISTNQTKIDLQKEDAAALDLQIKQKRADLEHVGENEDEEEDEGREDV